MISSDDNPNEVEEDYQDGSQSTTNRTDQYDHQAVTYSEASDGIGQKKYHKPHHGVDQEVLDRSQDYESAEDMARASTISPKIPVCIIINIKPVTI